MYVERERCTYIYIYIYTYVCSVSALLVVSPRRLLLYELKRTQIPELQQRTGRSMRYGHSCTHDNCNHIELPHDASYRHHKCLDHSH